MDEDIKSFGRNRPHTVPPTPPDIAHGATRGELTDEDIKKLNLFTDAELDLFLPYEITFLCSLPFEEVEAAVKKIREKQNEPR